MSKPAIPRMGLADYRDEAWAAGLFRLSLIVLLAASLSVAPMLIRLALRGDWPPYLIALSAAAGIEAVATTSLLDRPASRIHRGTAIRLGEMALILVLTRVAVWLLVEGAPQLSEVAVWLVRPGLFFTGEFVFAGGVLLFVWSVAAAMAADFQALAIRPDEVAARNSRHLGDAKTEWRVALPVARTDILQRFAMRWIGLGALLVLCAALTRVSVTTNELGAVHVGLSGLGLAPEGLAALLCYFIGGLLLMSHGRLAVLRGRWYNEEVEIRGMLLARWPAVSTAFVVAIALLALLMPLGAASWLAVPITWVIALLIRVALGIALLAGLVVAAISKFLYALLGLGEHGPASETAAAPPPVPTQAEMASRLPPWLGGAVLWAVILLVFGFLLLNLVRTSGLLEGPLGDRLRQLRFWWRARRARLTRAVASQIKTLRRRLRRPNATRRLPALQRRATQVRGRLPRDRVRQYYLEAVGQAADEGAPRPAHKTPLEYARDLEATWPEAETDVAGLTEAFLDARYTEHDIGEPAAAEAENTWRRLVRALRRRSPDGPAEGR